MAGRLNQLQDELLDFESKVSGAKNIRHFFVMLSRGGSVILNIFDNTGQMIKNKKKFYEVGVIFIFCNITYKMVREITFVNG